MIGHEIVGQWTNHLWQSTLFAAVAALVALAFRKNRAHVRYWVWFSASIKFLLPFALLMNLGNSLWTAFAAKTIATALAPPALSFTVQQIAQPFPHASSFALATPLAYTANWILIAVLCVWICGFLAVAVIAFAAGSAFRLHYERACRSISTPSSPSVPRRDCSNPVWSGFCTRSFYCLRAS
jgi:hypothetical protein